MYKNPTAPLRLPVGSAFLAFSTIVFFLSFGDAIMSYATPVFLDTQYNDTFLVGLVFSFSSLIGLIFDFFAGEKLKSRGFKFFIWATVAFAIAFPAIFVFLPHKLFTILLALGIWGIYYETIAFSKYRFIQFSISRREYANAWGITSNLNSIAYLVGPTLASYLVSRSLNLSFYTSLAIFSFALVGLVLFTYTYKHKQVDKGEQVKNRVSIREEFRIWRTLGRKLWLMWIFSFFLISIDAVFWTVGILLAEQIKAKYNIGEWFILAYMLPGTLMGMTLPLMSKIYGGKKRTAFIMAGCGGILYAIFGLANNLFVILSALFVASVFTSIAFPALSATYEDYIERLGIFGNDLIGLDRTSGSLAYIIAPVLFGALAPIIGNQAVFAAAGGLLTLTSLTALFLVPRKIKMPQKELALLD